MTDSVVVRMRCNSVKLFEPCADVSLSALPTGNEAIAHHSPSAALTINVAAGLPAHALFKPGRRYTVTIQEIPHDA